MVSFIILKACSGALDQAKRTVLTSLNHGSPCQPPILPGISNLPL